MIAYAVRTEFTVSGGAFQAEVDGPRGIRGTGYGATEEEAVTAAWSDYWRRLGM